MITEKDCIHGPLILARSMYTFLISKLNTELHGKTIGIEARNGLELYRQVVKAVDDIPENAKFLMGPRFQNSSASTTTR